MLVNSECVLKHDTKVLLLLLCIDASGISIRQNIWTAGQGGYVCKWDREFNKCLKVFPVSDHFLAETAAVAFTSAQPGLRSLSAAPGTNSPILVATQHAELLLMDEEGQLNIIVQVGCRFSSGCLLKMRLFLASTPRYIRASSKARSTGPWQGRSVGPGHAPSADGGGDGGRRQHPPPLGLGGPLGARLSQPEEGRALRALPPHRHVRGSRLSGR